MYFFVFINNSCYFTDAVVMGGTANYEKAFFTEKYKTENPQDTGKIQQLKELIADQIPLLGLGMDIHEKKVPQDLIRLHEQMETLFQVERVKKSGDNSGAAELGAHGAYLRTNFLTNWQL